MRVGSSFILLLLLLGPFQIQTLASCANEDCSHGLNGIYFRLLVLMVA
jgi:hypothetical protein